jgi:2-dehydropantoate 2-reductase
VSRGMVAMKHAILGVGAIGGLVGTMLASLGEDVTVLVRPQRLANYPKNLTLQRPSGAITAPAKAATTLTEPTDVLWIATKTYQLSSALEIIHALPGCVVPLLNGVDHVAILRERFGTERVVPGTITSETESSAPGKFIQRSPVVHLNLAASGEPTLRDVVARLGKEGLICRFVSNEQTLLWSKLCFLAPFALATSASGKNAGEILANAIWKQQLSSAIAEACAVAHASGTEVAAAEIEGRITNGPAAMRSSMQKDLEAGRELELDAIGGPIVRGGKRYGIDVATTTKLMDAIRAKASPRSSQPRVK